MTDSAPRSKPPQRWHLPTWLLPSAVLACAVAATPLTPLLLAWLFLLFYGKTDRRAIAALLGCVVFSMAVIYASRQVGRSPFDDFWNIYYPTYLEAKRTSTLEFLLQPFEEVQFSTIEVAFPALIALIALLPGMASPNLVIFLVTGGIGGLYAWWLSRYFLPEVPQSHRAAAGLLCIVFFSFGLCSQTIRQMMSVPILLAAIWERRLSSSAVLALFATTCHFSAAPIWAFAILFRFTGYRTLLLVATPLVYMLSIGNGLTESLIGLDAAAVDKLRYYTDGNQDAAGYDSSFTPLIWIIAGGSLAITHFRKGELSRLLLFFCLLFFALLPLPMASFRITLFITTALIAPLLCLAVMHRLSALAFRILCGIMTIAMIFRRVLVVDESSGMALWNLFNPVGVSPFQYLVRLFLGT